MSAFTQASSSSVELSQIDTKGIYSTPYAGLSSELAKLTSSLLNKNHQEFHIYFNEQGFHNHIVHHLLSLYALNASLPSINKAWDHDASYQRPLSPPDVAVVADMEKSRNNITKYLPGDENSMDASNEISGTQYSNFLEFWKRELSARGVKGVLDEWVFKGDEVAEKVFGRLFAGFVHPLIHAGFALEFHQPAILAEALAEACVHENWIYPLIQGCEARSKALKNNKTPPRNLNDLLEEAYNNTKLRESPHWEDGNKVRDGVLKRAGQELIDLASQWFVPTKDATWETVNEKVAEHIHAAFLFASTAAFHTTIRPDGSKIQHQPKLDFFYIHATNASIFYSSFANDEHVRDILGINNVIRLLEAKAWVDLAMYLSRRAHAITPTQINLIKTYEPTTTSTKSSPTAPVTQNWAAIFERVINLPSDDGHAVKFIRAVANAERACRPYEDRDWCVIKGDMWVRIGWMAVESFETQPDFLRNVGWDETWKDIPEWKKSARL